MEFVNYTPFSPFVFQSEDVERQEFFVVVLRGTFAIDAGRPLRMLPEQERVVRADRYRGGLHRSSLLVESDLAPFKPRADIHIEAVAHCPGGRPSPSWLVRAQVGQLSKSLRVTGPRHFRAARRRWILSDPEPCTEVPIHYEYAFGGGQHVDGKEYVDERNPVGLGWQHPEGRGAAKNGDPIPAPRIEAPDDPVRELGVEHTPQGLGPIARAWLPRRALAGTLDERWRDERCPALPEDFDFAHYNSAHPDLVYPGYLKGDEKVCLEGLDPSGSLEFTLPGHLLRVGLFDRKGTEVTVDCVLDTLRLDLPRQRASITWRGRSSGSATVDRAVAKMIPISAPGEDARHADG